MSRAFVLMTALPPTKGHVDLMRFASHVGDQRARILVCTQPSEPFANERFLAVQHESFATNGADVRHLHRELPQDPDTPGFWEMWDAIMADHGFLPGDFVVSSEAYGATLAQRLGGIFIPYDPNREMRYTKATDIRNNPRKHFADIANSFQRHLRTTVTVFGAESTGKTTLSKELAATIDGHWRFEWARPYLETVGPEITVDAMTAIWHGQRATQKSAAHLFDKPFVVQDTDLFSTAGYWEQPHWMQALGPVPDGLVKDAIDLRSDLYIITRSNIPFEADPLRYGGDVRESSDQYWVDVAERYGLDYVVLDDADLMRRVSFAAVEARKASDEIVGQIAHDRGGF